MLVCSYAPLLHLHKVMAHLHIGAISIEIIPVLDFIDHRHHRHQNFEKNIDMKDVGIFAIIQMYIAFGLTNIAGDADRFTTAGKV